MIGDANDFPNVHWSESDYFNPPVPPPTAWTPIRVLIPRKSIYGGRVRGEAMVRRFFYQQRGGVEHPFKRTTIEWKNQYCSIEQAAAAILRGE